jgi:putative exporter of polyketide antibiotics
MSATATAAPGADSPPPSSAEKLYGRASKTAASRFNAARRLKQQNLASLWTIALFSLGLIFVSLMQALEFSLPYSDRTVNLVEVFFSITILVISVILSMR